MTVVRTTWCHRYLRQRSRMGNRLLCRSSFGGNRHEPTPRAPEVHVHSATSLVVASLQLGNSLLDRERQIQHTSAGISPTVQPHKVQVVANRDRFPIHLPGMHNAG